MSKNLSIYMLLSYHTHFSLNKNFIPCKYITYYTYEASRTKQRRRNQQQDDDDEDDDNNSYEY